MMENRDKELILLGSTGSVGEQAADVALRTGTKVCALVAGNNVKRMEEQARLFRPRACAMSDRDAADDLRIRLADTGIRVYAGSEGISALIREQTAVDNGERKIVLNAIVGEAGLQSTLDAIESGTDVALANKESLVVAGEIVMRRAKQHGVRILPVDSEHCAIFQCLRGEKREKIRRILLTASGGPFYGYTREQLADVTPERTLAHPTWKMGAKITVDSATLMNKGFEVIEAVHLFGVPPEAVEVVVQRESIIHSMVEYIDNSVIAQLAVPDMRHCVQYALSYPDRESGVCQPLDFRQLKQLHFGVPDTDAFPLLQLAFDAIHAGGALPAVVNAANEIAVAAFLDGRIGFLQISDVVIKTTQRLDAACREETLDGILAADRSARIVAGELIKNYGITR